MYALKPALHQRSRAHRPGDLRTVALDVTASCNMHCRHCYAQTFRQVEPLPLEVLLPALNEFYELGVFHYVLQGGEPILDPPRLEAIIRGAHPMETYFTVVSNGWNITPERIVWLKSLQVDKIALSLDSGIPEEHDANRLPGSFARVVHAVDDVIAEGLNVSISVTVTHQSLHTQSFERVLDIVRSKNIRMDVQIAEPVGKWDGRKDFLVTPEDSAYIKHLQESLGHLPNGQNQIHRDLFCGDSDHCPAGVEFLAVSPDGHLLPCNFLQFSLGKLGNRPIREMREALLKSPWFDGGHPCCLIGEDHCFINEYVLPYRNEPKPLNAYQAFGLARGPEVD